MKGRRIVVSCAGLGLCMLVVYGYNRELLISATGQYYERLGDARVYRKSGHQGDTQVYRKSGDQGDAQMYRKSGDPGDADLVYQGIELPQPYSSLFHRADMRPLINQSIRGSPFNYLPEYRNPCWLARTDVTKRDRRLMRMRAGTDAGTDADTDAGRLRCLPFVHLAGFAKSGTTDLYASLRRHPHILSKSKEPLFWGMGRYGHYGLHFFTEDLVRYVRYFDKPAMDITTNKQRIIMDASSTKVYYMDGWKGFPGNEGLPEPRYTVAMAIRALTPDARIIIIMRDPVERTYSRYRFYHARHQNTSSPELFHKYVTAFVSEMQQCLQNLTLRVCAYDYDQFTTWNDYFTETHSLFIRASLYYVYVKDWLEAFPREQIYFVKSEEYYSNRTRTVTDIYRFLDLDPELISGEIYQAFEENRVRMRSPDSRTMLNKTRIMLREFFSPYNRMLADLLNDKRYTWEEQTD